MENLNEVYTEKVMDAFEKELTQNNNVIPACGRRLATLRRGARNSTIGFIGGAGSFAALYRLMFWMSRSVVNETDYIYNVYAFAVMFLMWLSACGILKYGEKSIDHIDNAKKLKKRLDNYVKKRDFAKQRIQECREIQNG